MFGARASWLLGLALLLVLANPGSGGAARANQLTYVSIGDSYSAGLGTQFGPVHDGRCDRTRQAWPNLLPKYIPRLVFKANLACSGARIADLFRSFKGEPPQAQTAAAMHPDVLTLTIGGNDLGFSADLRKCYVSDCSGVVVGLGQLFPLENHLMAALDRLGEMMPSTLILLVGYPRIFPDGWPTYKCGWLDQDEEDTMARNQSDANFYQWSSTGHASASNVGFIDISAAFQQHEFCTRDSWLFALRPTCARDARCGHPTAKGQNAIAAFISESMVLPK
jgi:hypothetical protein